MISRILLVFLLLLALTSCRENKSSGELIQEGSSVVLKEKEGSSVVHNEQDFNPADELFGLSEKWTGDLDGIIQRGRIRALVPYNRTSYYINGTKRAGITYEALNLFEKNLNEGLGKKSGTPGYVHVVYIPLTRDRILPALQEGYGDIAAANILVTTERRKTVDFSMPLLSNWKELVVAGPSARPLSEWEDLLGDTVYIRRSSSYFENLKVFNDSLQKAGKPEIEIKILEEHLEDDEILEMVHAGLIPITISNAFTVNLWEPILEDLQPKPEISLKTEGQIAWAMRKNSPGLKTAVDAFVKDHKKGSLMGNIVLNKYFNNSGYLKKANSPESLDQLLELRGLFSKYGEQYNFDWLFLAAVGFQESQLDNSKHSPVGAVGIMQIKPSTAADSNVGIDDVYGEENNIHAGTKYLNFIRNRYFSDPDIDPLNALLFSLAAYNMGPARLNRIRDKAADIGVDPNVWFGQIELLAAREVGREPVQYVSNIYNYYTSFRALQRYRQKTGKRID